MHLLHLNRVPDEPAHRSPLEGRGLLDAGSAHRSPHEGRWLLDAGCDRFCCSTTQEHDLEAKLIRVGGWDASSDSEGDHSVEGSEEHFDENVAKEERSIVLLFFLQKQNLKISICGFYRLRGWVL
jgi:hypothetical protein